MTVIPTNGSFRFEPVGQLRKGIEADHVDAVGDKVGECVDVVVEPLAIAIVGDVFHAADLDAGVLHDALDIGDDLARWLVAFHAYAALRRIDRACCAVQVHAAGGAADVCRAQVEGLAGNVDLDGVEIAAVQHLDAHDMRVARGNEFLHQRR